MKVRLQNVVMVLILLTGVIGLDAQCSTWLESDRQTEAEEAHTVYRQSVKDGDWATAFEYWQTAFEIAPAADGKRDFHYTDGIKIFKNKFKTEEENKKKNAQIIDELYNGVAECYEAGSISVYGCEGDDCGTIKAGNMLGRYGYDMVYELRSPLSKTFEVFEKAVKKAGMHSEYVILNPYAHATVNLFQREKISADMARAVHTELNAIADFNIENNEKFKSQFEQAKQAMNSLWSPIESEIFDCVYFKNKYESKYRESPEDIENLKVVYGVLIRNGCEDSDPLVSEIKMAYEKKAAELNAAVQAEFEKNNPAVVAKKLYDDGNYKEAISKYEEAMASEEDLIKKASYQFSIASIQFRKLNQYVEARKSARMSLKYRPEWGRPIMLIGDMYAKASNSCGKDAYSRGLVVLAAIDKWKAAKAKDPEVAAEAQKSINRYTAYIPPKNEIFMRPDVDEGQTVNCGCWVSENVVIKGK